MKLQDISFFFPFNSGESNTYQHSKGNDFQNTFQGEQGSKDNVEHL